MAAADSFQSSFTSIGWGLELYFGNQLKMKNTGEEMLQQVDSLFLQGKTRAAGTVMLLAHDQVNAVADDSMSLHECIKKLKIATQYNFEVISKYPGIKLTFRQNVFQFCQLKMIYFCILKINIMDLYKSGNPTLSDKAFKNSEYIDYNNSMTVRGTLNKFGFMFLMLMGTAYYSWKEFAQGGNVQPLIWGGAIGGLVVALVIMFKKEWSPYLAPLYALLEGLFLGAVSAFYNEAFAAKMPNIVMNAVGLTFGTAIAMYLLYSFKIIQATQKFRAVIVTATAGIAIFYLISIVLRMFGVQMAFLHEGSAMGIGFSLVVVAIAALNLILDFDMIEKGTAAGAPKYMEWYGAFGLMVTIVWLYLEIIRLLSKLAARK